MQRDIDYRYHGIKTDLRVLIDSLGGHEVVGNSQQSAIVCNNGDSVPTIYAVNADEYQWEMTAAMLALTYEQIQAILDKWLLEGGPSDIWAGAYVENEYRRGTQLAYTSLAAQSEIYKASTTLSALLFSEPYIRRIGIAFTATYSDWKGLSDKARADLCSVLSDAIARGINPRETAKIISKRLDVSMSYAYNIAQTEQLSALRNAIWDETVEAGNRLGLRLALLHQSALLPTSRTWHVYWHGRARTVEEVREWYSVDGNRYRCHCSQTPTLVDEKGQALNPRIVELLAKERKEWQMQEAA